MVINDNLDKMYYFMYKLLRIKYIYINYLKINNTIVIVNHRIFCILTNSRKESDLLICLTLIGNEFQRLVTV